MDDALKTSNGPVTKLDASPRTSAAVRRFAAAAIFLLVFIPVLSLIGWSFGIEVLKRVVPGLVEMNPFSAVNFILLAFALEVARRRQCSGGWRLLAALGALFVALFGARIAAKYLLAWDTNIDRVLFAASMGTNKMAPNTAFGFLLMGAAMLGLDVRTKRGWRPSEGLALAVALIALLALIGYAYGVVEFIGLAHYVPMALHVAFCFVLAAAASLAIRPEEGVAARFVSSGAGGAMTRRVLFWIVFVPLVLGWLILAGYRAGGYQAAFACTLFVVLAIAFVALVIWKNAGTLDRKELEQRRAEAELRRARDELEARVSERTADLSQVLGEISQGIAALTSFGREILEVATQMADGAGDTSAALNDTTATIEEVRQVSQLANLKAQEVAASAQEAARISHAGKHATQEMREGTQRIREQMESIAESMARLTEQSDAIGEIVAAVEDISQQSKVLAVNAEIEAAKAGEFGRGFDVVAQAVKFLTAQSRAATAQVRTNLHEIADATNKTAASTELGSRAVEEGMQRSDQAGQSILALAESVDRAAISAAQIAASSREQLVGVEQAALAMQRIRDASARNLGSATKMKTLAQKLEELGQRMKELAERYQV